jgi:medium-chain acyl-[acyl-carrier-protein] hydrolase
MSDWFVRPRSRSTAALRFFCFHYAGGGASIFRRWPESLPNFVELVAVQLPGRESRIGEPPIGEMAPLLTTLGKEIRPLCDRPFAFFGHSMGSLIAFELARSLEQKHGVRPLHLYASGHRAPHLPDPDPPVSGLPEPEFIAELRRVKGTPEEVLAHPELMELLLPLLRADFGFCERYVFTPGEPLFCPITAFGGATDEDVSEAELAAWAEHTRSSFTTHILRGDHFFITSAARELLGLLSRSLESLPLGAPRR